MKRQFFRSGLIYNIKDKGILMSKSKNEIRDLGFKVFNNRSDHGSRDQIYFKTYELGNDRVITIFLNHTRYENYSNYRLTIKDTTSSNDHLLLAFPKLNEHQVLNNLSHYCKRLIHGYEALQDN